MPATKMHTRYQCQCIFSTSVVSGYIMGILHPMNFPMLLGQLILWSGALQRWRCFLPWLLLGSIDRGEFSNHHFLSGVGSFFWTPDEYSVRSFSPLILQEISLVESGGPIGIQKTLRFIQGGPLEWLHVVQNRIYYISLRLLDAMTSTSKIGWIQFQALNKLRKSDRNNALCRIHLYKWHYE